MLLSCLLWYSKRNFVSQNLDCGVKVKQWGNRIEEVAGDLAWVTTGLRFRLSLKMQPFSFYQSIPTRTAAQAVLGAQGRDQGRCQDCAKPLLKAE